MASSGSPVTWTCTGGESSDGTAPLASLTTVNLSGPQAGRPSTKGSDVPDGDPRYRPHSLRKDGRGPLLTRRSGPRRHGDRVGSRALRGGARAGPGGDLRTGASGRTGADPLPPGSGQGRNPARGAVGDHQQGVRLRNAHDRPRGSGDPG